MSSDRTVSFEDAECIASTAMALLIRFDDGTEDWVPRSQVTDDSEVYEEGHVGELIITRWLAEQKSWV